MADQALTVEQFKAALPKGMSKSVGPLTIMRINNILCDPEEAEMFRDNLIGYTSVLRDGKFKMSSYLDAVRYVGFKTMGLNIKESHQRTFPDKHSDWAARGVAAKDVASYTTAYNKSKLVTLIFEQSLVPTHILNADAFQKAINHQVWLMLNAKSEMVQTNAANSLMIHLKAPEAQKVELDIVVQDNTMLQELKDVTVRLAAKQREIIEAGLCSPKEIAQQDIIEIQGKVV